MLLNLLDDGPFDTLDFSQVTIITFNYDRSLEQFLSRTLCNRHDKQCDAVGEKLKGLRIIHVYGYLGGLDWQVTSGRKYSSSLDYSEVNKAAQGIKIISEGRDDSDELIAARAALVGAERTFILGMAYHKDNMRRIGLPFLKGEGAGKPISGVSI